VRYFLNDFPEQTMQAVHAWARDGDYRVRRLASESTRPVLPWSPVGLENAVRQLRRANLSGDRLVATAMIQP
jgi:3-methyladenine DNA glycosylase AlkC